MTTARAFLLCLALAACGRRQSAQAPREPLPASLFGFELGQSAEGVDRRAAELKARVPPPDPATALNPDLRIYWIYGDPDSYVLHVALSGGRVTRLEGHYVRGPGQTFEETIEKALDAWGPPASVEAASLSNDWWEKTSWEDARIRYELWRLQAGSPGAAGAAAGVLRSAPSSLARERTVNWDLEAYREAGRLARERARRLFGGAPAERPAPGP